MQRELQSDRKLKLKVTKPLPSGSLLHHGFAWTIVHTRMAVVSKKAKAAWTQLELTIIRVTVVI